MAVQAPWPTVVAPDLASTCFQLMGGAVVAVQLAKRGIRGAQGVFEGADGFFRVYLRGHVDAEKVRKDLGRRFELMSLSYKPYPCCRDVHTAVDAVLQARVKAQRRASDIQSIRVGVTAPGYQWFVSPSTSAWRRARSSRRSSAFPTRWPHPGWTAV